MEINPVYTFEPAKISQNQDALQALIAKAKEGSQPAFAEIYNLYFKKIYKFIYFRVGHKEAAEDLAEDVFVKAFEKIKTINNNNSFDAWLYQIARNKIIDYYREKKSTIALEEVENTLEYETNVIDAVDLKDRQKALLKMMKELGTEQQAVLKLKFLEDFSNKEIAELLNKNEGAIRVIQHRAITKLQELINKPDLK